MYCSILVARLTFITQLYSKISERHCEFKSGYSSINNALILRSVIERSLGKTKGKICVAFVDFQNCFNTINRDILWPILRKME